MEAQGIRPYRIEPLQQNNDIVAMSRPSAIWGRSESQIELWKINFLNAEIRGSSSIRTWARGEDISNLV